MTRSVSSGADVVVGAGHNGLVAACYLAQAGRDVVVVEQLDRPGGGSRTEETVPGYRFDLHSAAHNIINMTDIPAELDLAGAGLDYIEMDPFSIAVHEDGRRVRFYRSIEATVESIAEESPQEAQAYRRFLDKIPLVRTVMPAIRGELSLKLLPGRVAHLVRALRHQPLTTARDVMSPYDALLRRWLPSDLTRGPVAAFAAHAGVGPTVPGSAFFAFWQAAYHLFGQWHGRRGAQNLTDALVSRLHSLGGELRCSAPVARIEAGGGRVRAVVLDSGERISAASVITAMDPKTALLKLLDPPLGGDAGADLAAARRSNVVQAVVHVATDALPPMPTAATVTGTACRATSIAWTTSPAWTQSEAGRLPDPLPLYAFTPSALDDTLAPRGHHTVYLACPAAPAKVEGGWADRKEELVERCLETVDSRAPGFGDSVRGPPPGLPTTWSASSAGRSGTPCTSTSPWTSSVRSAPPGDSAAGAHPSRGSTSPVPGPTLRAGSPAHPAARLPGRCCPTSE